MRVRSVTGPWSSFDLRRPGKDNPDSGVERVVVLEAVRSAPGAAPRPPGSGGSLEARLQRLLLELRGALARALSQSSDASRAVREIHSEGWSLYLVVDQRQDDGRGSALELTGESEPPPPVFKIDGSDLTFLRSIGIDPTRKLRRRRS